MRILQKAKLLKTRLLARRSARGSLHLFDLDLFSLGYFDFRRGNQVRDVLLFSALLLAAFVFAHSQTPGAPPASNYPAFVIVMSAPSGSCPIFTPAQMVASTGAVYTCQSGTWAQLTGSGSMTWPTGSAGIPNYSGSSSWGTTYNSSNTIPANFIPTLNQNTTGTASNVSGTPALPNGTTATTQSVADNSTKIATDAFVLANSSGYSPTMFQSSTSTGNIGSTSLVASTSGTPGLYTLKWEISLTAVGVSCTGTTTVTLNDIFTDPANSVATTNPIGTINLAVNGNGATGYIASGQETILSKNASAISYSTTSYTAGSGCGTNPTYQVSGSIIYEGQP